MELKSLEDWVVEKVVQVGAECSRRCEFPGGPTREYQVRVDPKIN